MNVPINLSIEQAYALDAFRKGSNLFVTGPGGTGKTRLIKQMLGVGGGIQVCAMTGCAALLLGCGARTLHSWSGIKLAKGPRNKIIEGILRNRRVCMAWKKVRVLVVDEVSMMSKKIFELCEEIARIIRRNDQPFGGIQVVFTGDFYQLPPVGTVGDPDTDAFCFESQKWNDVFRPENHIVLETMFRQTDPTYIQLLSEIRRGEISEEGQQILSSKVKREYNPADYAGCVLTKLFPIRAKADFVNQAQYAKIDSDEMVFDVQKNLCCGVYMDNGKGLSVEDIDKCVGLSLVEKQQHVDWLIANTNCVERLCLKRGTAVMCTANIDMDSGICNGSQGIVVDFTNGNIIVKFSNGLLRPVERHHWQSDEYPVVAISQYPLCLAWALTIHKIQGATMPRAEMDLGNSIFEYGQTYVALSRIQSLDGLYLSAFRSDRIRANPKVRAFYESIPAIDMTPKSVIENVATSSCGNEAEVGEAVIDSTCDDSSIKKINFDTYKYAGDISTKKITVVKKPTHAVTLDLFLAGKTIDEIAVERGLKKQTIEDHLVENVPHEGIPYQTFMTEVIYGYIVDAFQVLGKDIPLKVVKDNLPREVSYLQIKMVRKMIR